ncbi:MAG: S1C family serine protease [Sandaracinaceae bacterium]
MQRMMLALVVSGVATLCVLSPASAQDIQLRPIDRATLRVIGVSGMEIATGPGRRTRTRRVSANPSMGHGSGVAIGPRLILTARHVVWSMHAYAVVPPGGDDPIPARLVYVDLDADVAFLLVDRDLPHHITLHEARTLRMSEPVSVSGYPLDMREPNPAASSGEVSRIARDGLLHLTLSANPGNSGGPVVDAAGHLIGIVSMRGRPEAGVEGLVIAVPVGMVLAAHAQIPEAAPRFEAHERDLARGISLLAALTDDRLHEARTEVTAIMARARVATTLTAEHALIFSALGWNTTLAVLEAEGASELSQLQGQAGTDAVTMHAAAALLAQNALHHAPHVRRRYGAARAISLGRVAPFGTAAQR